MKALSIRQPWAHLILCGLKGIENRSWTTDYRGPLVIHAGTKLDPGWEDAIAEVSQRRLRRWSAGFYFEAMAGTCPGVHVVTTTKRGCLLGIVWLNDVVTESESPWFFGPYGWVLANPRVFFAPIPWRGRLGLFDVPEDVIGDGAGK